MIRSSAISPELLAQIRRIYFQTRRAANEGLSGRYRSAFLGHGLEFEEVREYQPGDEIRSIDWKVTARSRKPFIKSFREERELTVVIAVDLSASLHTGSRKRLRQQALAETAAMLALIALRNNDRVGLLLFSDRVLGYHPPRKNRSGVWQIIHEVYSSVAPGAKTDLGAATEYLRGVLKRPAVIFVLSDFFGDLSPRSLSLLARKHDVTAIPVRDPLDGAIPDVGLVQISDPESGASRVVDSSDRAFRESYRHRVVQRWDATRRALQRGGWNLLEISTDGDSARRLRTFFEQRKRRRGVSQKVDYAAREEL